MVIKRLGFACKWIDTSDQINGIGATDAAKQLNTRTTTLRWLREQPVAEAQTRLQELLVHNTSATLQLIARVGALAPGRRMVRLSSDLVPAYTAPEWQQFWAASENKNELQKRFAQIGELARALDVRLSFHPGQFTVLASDNPGIVKKSIEEFEYHADMVRYMGFGQKFQDFKVNIHISGRRGPAGLLEAYAALSSEARNTITVENEENSWGLADCLEVAHQIPIVLDIHHHWCREGEYIDPHGSQVAKVIASWRGVRPTLHYSVSREDVLQAHDASQMPDMQALKRGGFKKAHLRAHSDWYWNTAVNKWALQFLENFDIMCESKAKNLASEQLHNLSLK